MITENEQDELIFDFLEGNLSPDEKEAFLILKDESEVLSRQIRLWENTYLQEPLPSVEALEQRLLIRVDNGTRGFSSRIYVLFIMMLAILPIVGDRQEASIRTTSFAHVDITRPLISKEELQYFERIPKAVEKKKEGTNKQQIPETAPVNIFQFLPSYSVSDMKVDEVHASQDLALKKVSLAKLRVKTPATTFRKQWLGKERRAIRKKKRKDSSAKHAGEFMKGNVPYVVPLNSNNF
jgi:hypothetical protein